MSRYSLRKVTSLCALLAALAGLAVAVWLPPGVVRQASFDAEKLKSLSKAEFSQLVRDLSEEGGYFRSDNFISNETSYLHVLDKLREMRISGGAYVGVGPEQNFTYIAKLRPQIAFIVDIRRQAMLQHLMYKALFHMSDNRAEFLSNLVSRPISGSGAPGKGASTERLIDYLSAAPASDKTFTANLGKIRKRIEEDFRVPLSGLDVEQLSYVYSVFHKEGLEISYSTGWMNRNRGGFGGFPSLGDLILQPDLNGKPGNFLASEEDYQFVRDLHKRNRIIPIVGDFAGSKALASVGEYLQKNGYIISAFYTSNVEQYLFRNGVFRAFADNVRKFPVDSDSVFIRAVPSMEQSHPARVPGHRLTTLLQRIPVFLKDYDEGLYTDYWTLVTTHFIAAQSN